MKSFQLKINSLKFQLYSWGKPSLPKLFLFHGWMDSGASFQFLCEHLQKKFHCIAPDLRGFGQTEHSKNKIGYFFYEYLSDAYQIFQKLAPGEKIKSIGHSMGGNLLSLYAGAFPEQISHFVNLEGFGIRDTPIEKVTEKVREWIESPLNDFKVYKSLKEVAKRLKQTNPRLPEKRISQIIKYLSKKTKNGFSFSADPRHKWPNPYLYRLENVIPFWKKIQAKCLLVMGEKSEMLNETFLGKNPQEELEKRLSYFPVNSERVYVSDSGHMMHLEAPEKLAKLIGHFLIGTNNS